MSDFINAEKPYSVSRLNQLEIKQIRLVSMKGSPPHHEPTWVRHLFEDMRGLRGDCGHSAAPQHRVQPWIIDSVEGEVNVRL